MEISDIKVRKTFDEGALKAIVSITFDNALAVHDVKIINAKEKLFLIMPSRVNKNDGSYKDIVHPINSEFRKKLESAIIAKYQEELEAKKEAQEALVGAYEEDEAAIDDEEDEDEDDEDEEDEEEGEF